MKFFNLLNFFFKRKVNSFVDNQSFQDTASDYFGVIQFQHQNFKSWKEFHAKILSNVKSAKGQGAKFILFPAGMNIELYTSDEGTLSDGQISKAADEVLKIFCAVASSENVYIAYADLVRGQRVFHMIGNTGKEMKGKIFEIYGSIVSFMDEDIPDDVKVVLNPLLLKKWTGDYESFGHAWLFSQQKYVYSLESYIVGDHFIGQSGIYSPIEATESMSGIIKQAQSKILEEILVSHLDFNLIDEIRMKKDLKSYARLLNK
ncbi:carbon-nitrogen hydrolase family protein [Athalassotoga saccharophila]|uniref:hypothetical protein n=1 Tax=Athalassotoga saccharophila TaxID=1441386 RepID=UPI00137B6BA3|nr:hypothetical protein [Athalassotoga saccharophila]BBJ28014.1 hypothetical protein ATHSA_0914 [Athalassotoga saccharophila]